MSEKLIRDRVPEIIRQHGGPSGQVRRAASDYEFAILLRQKLVEEVDELLHAGSPESMVEECADVLQVLYELFAAANVGSVELELARMEKASRVGTFSRRLVWRGDLSTQPYENG